MMPSPEPPSLLRASADMYDRVGLVFAIAATLPGFERFGPLRILLGALVFFMVAVVMKLAASVQEVK